MFHFSTEYKTFVFKVKSDYLNEQYLLKARIIFNTAICFKFVNMFDRPNAKYIENNRWHSVIKVTKQKLKSCMDLGK